MKTVFFHENELTVAYDLEVLDGSVQFQKGDVLEINMGMSVRHPKDSPNRKIGNSVAAGRMAKTEITISNIVFTHDNGVVFWAYNMTHQFCFAKKADNKNFYLVGIHCLK